jgi:hypothetical protein
MERWAGLCCSCTLIYVIVLEASLIQFKWIDWNVDKIAAHNLSAAEVEAAFENRIGSPKERADGSYVTSGRTASGREVQVIWRYDEEFDALEEGQVVSVIFVITAY